MTTKPDLSFLVLAIAAALTSACDGGPSSLAEASSPVGTSCSGPPDGEAVFSAGAWSDGPSYGLFFDGQMHVVLGEDSERFSDCSGLATNGPRFIMPAQLGDHIIDGTTVRFSIGGSLPEGSSGVISIDGYDPGSGLLCGSLDAVTPGGNAVRGRFAAQMRCP